MKPHSFLIYLLIFFFASSCSFGKKGTASLKKRSANYIIKRIDKNAFTADWLTGKAKMNISFQGQKLPSVTMNLKMQKDKIIWANVKKLGIELGRLQITTDSIFLLDRFNKYYLAKGIGELTDAYGIPADFSTIQDVLFGNAFFWKKDGLKSELKKTSYEISGDFNEKQSKHEIDGLNYLLESQYLVDENQNWELEANYGGYGSGEESNFSFIRNIKVLQPEMIDLTLSFSKININQPASISFEIPAHYTPLPME